MDRLILPQLVAVREPGDVIASDTFNEKKHPAIFGFMFTSVEAFNRFAESKPENKLQLNRLAYPSLLMTLKRTRDESNIDCIILDYAYEKISRHNHMYSLFDVKDAIAALGNWGEKTKWGEDVENVPMSEKPPQPIVERLTGFY